MRISQRQFGAARVFDLQGALVGRDASLETQRALAPRAPTDAGVTVVNLSGVAEIDIEGLLTLGEADRAIRRAGGAFRIALIDDGRRPVMVRRIRALFDSFDSVEDAVADLRARMVAARPLPGVAWLRAAWARLCARPPTT